MKIMYWRVDMAKSMVRKNVYYESYIYVYIYTYQVCTIEFNRTNLQYKLFSFIQVLFIFYQRKVQIYLIQ